MKIETNKYPYYIDIDTKRYDRPTRTEMWQWCKLTFGTGNDFNNDIWTWDNSDEYLGTFKFMDLQSAEWFVLRWT